MSEQETPSKDSIKPSIFHVKRIRVSTALIGFCLIALLVVAGITGIVSVWPDSMVGIAFRRVMPFPVVIVDGSIVWYRDLDESRRALRHYYESQSESLAENGLRVDFDTPDGKKRLLVREKDILNKLTENRAIRILAERRDVHFSNADAEKGIQDAIEQSGGSREVFEGHLKDLYGWDIDDFRDRVVLPSLYRNALETTFNDERDVSSAKSAIQKALDAISQGESFEDVARQYSDGDSKERGGDLGWVLLDTLVPELAEAARNQSIGVSGPVIESEIGYHIAFVIDRKTEDGKELARIRQVFSRKPSFPEWLFEEKRKLSVHILPRRYVWNSKTALVEFRDSTLRDFETEALKKTDGDPSFIF